MERMRFIFLCIQSSKEPQQPVPQCRELESWFVAGAVEDLCEFLGCEVPGEVDWDGGVQGFAVEFFESQCGGWPGGGPLVWVMDFHAHLGGVVGLEGVLDRIEYQCKAPETSYTSSHVTQGSNFH